ncbi:MAG TPA: phosphopantothenoylcysteine decarboxylase, partial [Limnobacter sp.]|nr:phosphopantothenoylcysteine decarboxylase [Limnobacter sp.]
MHHLSASDCFVGVAAVADYGIKNPSANKQKKSDDAAPGLAMAFELNPDILADVGAISEQTGKPRTVIGFAAETENLDEYATQKLRKKKAHYIIGNLAQHALGAEQVALTAYSHDQPPVRLPELPKLQAALAMLERIIL